MRYSDQIHITQMYLFKRFIVIQQSLSFLFQFIFLNYNEKQRFYIKLCNTGIDVKLEVLVYDCRHLVCIINDLMIIHVLSLPRKVSNTHCLVSKIVFVLTYTDVIHYYVSHFIKETCCFCSSCMWLLTKYSQTNNMDQCITK